MSTGASESPVDDSRTLISSVLFLDIAGYSRLGVTDQIKLKQTFNEVLSTALADMDARERVIIDTGDGAAVAFLGDPGRAHRQACAHARGVCHEPGGARRAARGRDAAHARPAPPERLARGAGARHR